jgi:hypothetical protein
MLYYVCPRLPADAALRSIDKLTPVEKTRFTGSLIQLFLDEYELGDDAKDRPGYLAVGNTSSKFCEPGRYEPTRTIVSHFPLTTDLAETRAGAAMFRRPGDRIRSAYNHDLHAFRMPPRQRNKMLKSVHNSHDFAAWPGVAACQTKMMLGEFCGKKPLVEMDEAQYAEAERRLRTGLAFVGITEHWDLSICLFHAMFGGVPRPGSFANTRRGDALTNRTVVGYSSSKGTEVVPSGADGLKSKEGGVATEADDADDAWDTRLYLAARRLFVERLVIHHLAVPNELQDGL